MASDRSGPARRGPVSHPAQLVLSGFVMIISVGTLLLMLPFSHEDGVPGVGLVDSFFTSVSATTVTGLAVVDTGSTFSTFGELVILAMIQLGGLGIMTIASVATLFFSKRFGVRQSLLANTEIGLGELGELRPVVRAIFRFTVLVEGVSGMLLSARFMLEGEHSTIGSLYLGFYHSISAFNNAGFSPLAGNLERYLGDTWVSLVVAGTIVCGGIGFPVALELAQRFRTPSRWSLHTKVTVLATATLIVIGTAVILVVEWSNPSTIADLSFGDKFVAAFFQSVTTRTAGFNTMPMVDLRGGTIMIMLLLMTIGASSASTGGGIKTSTFAIVVWTMLAEFRGDDEVTMFKRRVPQALQRQALALVVAALATIGTVTFFLSMLKPDLPLVSVLFESASAFGTVGLSVGATPLLGDVGKLIVSALMFIGRVGPVTFGTAFLFRKTKSQFRYPEEKLLVG